MKDAELDQIRITEFKVKFWQAFSVVETLVNHCLENNFYSINEKAAQVFTYPHSKEIFINNNSCNALPDSEGIKLASAFKKKLIRCLIKEQKAEMFTSITEPLNQASTWLSYKRFR